MPWKFEDAKTSVCPFDLGTLADFQKLSKSTDFLINIIKIKMCIIFIIYIEYVDYIS